MKELLVATTNKGKLREIKVLLSGMPFMITSLADYPHLPPVVEDGVTFKSNAEKKALTIAQATGTLTLGEDSGLEVRALDNRPGVYSARFSGPRADDRKNNLKLLRLLRGVPADQRQARYRCYIALADGRGIVGGVNGSCSGYITDRARGENGFGYDPLFLIPRYQKTFGELDPAIKSRLSHRAKALKKLKVLLEFYKG
ncbi:MAG TPA: RdgB/HAM1 family non-canonical purine NTP pyrophosphatase [Candidatus Omnitrophota bacterium]|nr:RdgB/HAM1 family non-canonical purine NTP pyrophosphatase [Candidatus Omnitrophota bacterium]HPB68046.1 RdgB/HAM1 family non-canonical purine NTP pyrophosphatase [Candidatus Omnitrophota bacterium]HQO58378.1 RdgB/HAM1 family non-canonical purine NTP pyrophosphatase [Candidatus Omnitrophota bacterium]HQP12958.1 RdgB/HAM1 family non-canonical purine NTP pyrophosphatase [Candidatus Omnitrophota bacterium]